MARDIIRRLAPIVFQKRGDEMNCPECGLEVAAGQRFCRSCGVSLQMITRPLTDAPVLERHNRPAILIQEEKQRSNSLVLSGFITMFVGVAVGVVGKMLLHQDIVTVVGVLVSLIGMFLTVYPYVSPPRQKHISGSSSETDLLAASQSKNYLPQGTNPAYTPSVTERTTDLLRDATAMTPSREEDEKVQQRHNRAER